MVVKSKAVYAGNPISNEELLSFSMKEIDSRLKNKYDKNNMVNIVSSYAKDIKTVIRTNRD